jgi:hypothetical protein
MQVAEKFEHLLDTYRRTDIGGRASNSTRRQTA